MSYDPKIPLPTESPSNSASPIQVNFSQFATIFSTLAGGINYNHMPFNTSHQGKHAAIILEKQALDPVVEGSLDALYCKDTTTTASTEPQLYVRIPNFLPTDIDTRDAPNDPMQLTYNSVGTAGPIYYSFLPGGYLIYFGSQVKNTAITLSPTPASILCVQAFPTGTGNASHGGGTTQTNVPYDVWVQVDQTLKQVTIRSTRAPGASNFFWMAIGRN